MPGKIADRPMLTRREAVELVHVPLGALDKAIEQKVVTAHRRRDRTWLRSEDIGVVVLLQRTAFPLPVTVKRKIKRWVRETEPYRLEHDSELAISDALIIRWSSELTEMVQAAESYARLRDQWIETDPSIKGGGGRGGPKHQGRRAGHPQHTPRRSRGRSAPRSRRHDRDPGRGLPPHSCGGVPDRIHLRASAPPPRPAGQALAGQR